MEFRGDIKEQFPFNNLTQCDFDKTCTRPNRNHRPMSDDKLPHSLNYHVDQCLERNDLERLFE